MVFISLLMSNCVCHKSLSWSNIISSNLLSERSAVAISLIFPLVGISRCLSQEFLLSRCTTKSRLFVVSKKRVRLLLVSFVMKTSRIANGTMLCQSFHFPAATR